MTKLFKIVQTVFHAKVYDRFQQDNPAVEPGNPMGMPQNALRKLKTEFDHSYPNIDVTAF